MGKEELVVLSTLSLSMAEKWENPFRTSQAGLTAGLKFWLRGHIPVYSA